LIGNCYAGRRELLNIARLAIFSENIRIKSAAEMRMIGAMAAALSKFHQRSGAGGEILSPPIKH
jgi:hypothetical protein